MKPDEHGYTLGAPINIPVEDAFPGIATAPIGSVATFVVTRVHKDSFEMEFSRRRPHRKERCAAAYRRKTGKATYARSARRRNSRACDEEAADWESL